MTKEPKRTHATAKTDDSVPDTSLEEEYVAALHAHFRVHGKKAIEDLHRDPVAYLRQVAAVKDKVRVEDAIDRLTMEEVEREIRRIERKLTAGKKKTALPAA